MARLRAHAIAPYRREMKRNEDSAGALARLTAAALLLGLAPATAVFASPGAIELALQGEPVIVTAQNPMESVDEPLPTILRSESDMPEPVREMRQKLVEAAKSGDIEKLRTLMQAQPEPPSVAFGDPGDPIEYLKALAADAEGREILAILLEVLESGFAHTGAGTPDELYVWPYFAQYPIDALTPEQLVELFTLLTAADYEDMKSYGSYTFFRVGIAPDGRWLFFLAGD